MIPEAAVEAAAEVAHRGLHGDALGEYGDSYQCEYKGTIHAALEAAAPHMTNTHDESKGNKMSDLTNLTLRDVLDGCLPDSVLAEERDYIEESILAAGYRKRTP